MLTDSVVRIAMEDEEVKAEVFPILESEYQQMEYYQPSVCETRLHWIVANGSSHDVKRLIDDGTNIESTDAQGKTAAFYALPFTCDLYHNYKSKCLRYEDIVSLLKTNSNLDLDYSGSSEALCVLKNKQTKYTNLQTLLDYGANIKATDIFGTTMLHITALCGDIHTTQKLLERGSNVNAIDRWNRRPISNAIECNNPEIVELLVKFGANVRDLKTSIAFAFRNNYQDTLNTLLKNLDVLPVDQFFIQLAVYLCTRGNEQTLEILLENGLAANVRSNSGLSLLDYAVSSKQLNIAILLTDNGADVMNDPLGNGYTTFHRAIHSGKEKMVELLVQSRADLSLLSRMKIEPWQPDVKLAMLTNSIKFFKYIVYNGANIHALDKTNSNLLHIAAREMKIPCYYEIIVALDYDLTALDKDQRDCLLQQRRCIKNIEDCVIYLIRNGVNINAKDAHGSSTMQYPVLFNANFAYVLIKQVAKLLERNVYVCDEIIKLMHSNKTFGRFYDICQEELKRMKTVFIEFTNISFYDVVCSKNREQIMHCSQNENIRKELESEKHEPFFPLYYNDFQILIQEGIDQRYLYENATLAISRLHQRGIPDSVAYKIMSYLQIHDIKNLVKSVDSSFYFQDRFVP